MKDPADTPCPNCGGKYVLCEPLPTVAATYGNGKAVHAIFGEPCSVLLTCGICGGQTVVTSWKVGDVVKRLDSLPGITPPSHPVRDLFGFSDACAAVLPVVRSAAESFTTIVQRSSTDAVASAAREALPSPLRIRQTFRVLELEAEARRLLEAVTAREPGD